MFPFGLLGFLCIFGAIPACAPKQPIIDFHDMTAAVFLAESFENAPLTFENCRNPALFRLCRWWKQSKSERPWFSSQLNNPLNYL
jgi:hypothetical protein